MTLHELKYCRYLLQCIKDLYIERAAMSTVLNAPNYQESAAVQDWRNAATVLCADPVFRSSIEANHAPALERLRCAMDNEKLLASMLNSPRPGK